MSLPTASLMSLPRKPALYSSSTYPKPPLALVAPICLLMYIYLFCWHRRQCLLFLRSPVMLQISYSSPDNQIKDKQINNNNNGWADICQTERQSLLSALLQRVAMAWEDVQEICNSHCFLYKEFAAVPSRTFKIVALQLHTNYSGVLENNLLCATFLGTLDMRPERIVAY